MTPTVRPPVEPMLGRLVRDLPRDGYVYEPKWDGFRCLAFRHGSGVELRSRHDRRLGRYFPELVEALSKLSGHDYVLDSELVAITPEGFDFTALMARLHPAASRVERLSRETPALLIAFDLLAVGEDDLRPKPFETRRARLARLLEGVESPLHLTPATRDPAIAARWLERYQGAGIDGVIAKRASLPYRPGERAMFKVKAERTADCVVAGLRPFFDRPAVSSLLLGLYDDAGRLQHVGVVTAFTEGRRRELLEELAPLAVRLEGHPWEHGFLLGGSPMGRLKGAAARWSPEEMELDWVPLAPTRVCEVAYDHVDRHRLRHPARFRRWRPDRDPCSCTLEQLTSSSAPAEILERT